MTKEDTVPRTCGIVMPISAIDGCSEEHWNDVLSIITAAIESAKFEANLVSNADDVGIIQKRIIQNLYENPVVVVDASGKNPNVMFELGMRLAFDRPTIIVKDDKTSYSFDTSPIEHLEYPRDLRFGKIVEFKDRLSKKIVSTYSASREDPNYTTFLKHFGEFKVAKLDTKEVTGAEYIIDEIKSLKISMARMERNSRFPIRENQQLFGKPGYKMKIETELDDDELFEEITRRISLIHGVDGMEVKSTKNKRIVTIYGSDLLDREELQRTVEPLLSGPSPEEGNSPTSNGIVGVGVTS